MRPRLRENQLPKVFQTPPSVTTSRCASPTRSAIRPPIFARRDVVGCATAGRRPGTVRTRWKGWEPRPVIAHNTPLRTPGQTGATTPSRVRRQTPQHPGVAYYARERMV